MALIPLWVVLVVTLLGFLYIIFAGRFVPGFRDEAMFFLIIVALWVIYGVTQSLQELIASVTGSKIAQFTLIGAVIIGIALYIRNRKKLKFK